MLGWIIGGLIAACAVTAIVVYVCGKINRQKIKEEMQSRNIKNGIVDIVNNCENVVKLKDLDGGTELELHGDDISYDVYEGQRIEVY